MKLPAGGDDESVEYEATPPATPHPSTSDTNLTKLRVVRRRATIGLSYDTTATVYTSTPAIHRAPRGYLKGTRQTLFYLNLSAAVVVPGRAGRRLASILGLAFYLPQSSYMDKESHFVSETQETIPQLPQQISWPDRKLPYRPVCNFVYQLSDN